MYASDRFRKGLTGFKRLFFTRVSVFDSKLAF